MVLGYTVKPFHRLMQQFQFQHKKTLQVAFRGSGKTTTCTVAKIIHAILKDPNIRILIVSKTGGAAADMLHEAKTHFESNEKLRAIFGDFVGKKWDNNRIEVKGKTIASKEPTVQTLGIESQVASKHYDLILIDDLIDEENARTQYMRDRTKTFFLKTLLPTLMSSGEMHILGTRYHYNDLYGWLEEDEYKGCFQRIKALEEDPPGSGHYKTPWPEEFSVKHFLALKKTMGTIIFNSQYQCDTEAMKGEIFDYDWMPECSLSEVPSTAKRYIGVDLAISENELADCFAIVVIAIEGRKIWVLDHYERPSVPFGKQVKKIQEYDKLYHPIRIGIESNQYQAALASHLREVDVDLPIRKLYTQKDKITRAHRLAGRFENGDFFFTPGNTLLIDHLVLFPGERKDLFDALYFAVRASKKRKKRVRRRQKEPSVI